VIIHSTFPNIPIHFNKFIGPVCSADLLIFKGTLLEVIEGNRLHFTEIYLSQISRTYQIENKKLFNFGEYECFAQTF